MELLFGDDNTDALQGGVGTGGIGTGGVGSDPLASFDDQRIEESPYDRSLLEQGVGLVDQTVRSFIEGFTALPVSDRPENTAEAIAGSIGHLAGFVGLVPGMGSLMSAGARGLSATLGRTAKALRLSSKTGKAGNQAARALFQNKADNILTKSLSTTQSIPFAVGDAAVRQAKKVGQSKAARSALDFMVKTEARRMVTKEGIRLGAAMGTSDAIRATMEEDTWGDTLTRLTSTIGQGAALGAGSAGLGVLFPGKTTQQGVRGFDQLMAGGKATRHALARSTASAAFEGMWSAYRNEPIELQVYNTLLGAYFGVQEIGPAQRGALRRIEQFRQDNPQVGDLQLAADPTRTSIYENAPENVRQEIELQADMMFGRIENAVKHTDDLDRDVPPGELAHLGSISQVETEAAKRIQNVVRDMGKEEVEQLPDALQELVRDEQFDFNADDAAQAQARSAARNRIGTFIREVTGEEAPGSNALPELSQHGRQWPTPGEIRTSLLQDDAGRRAAMEMMRQGTELEQKYRNHTSIAPMQRDLRAVADNIVGAMEGVDLEAAREAGRVEESPLESDLQGESVPTRTQVEMELAKFAHDTMAQYGEEGFREFVDTVEATYLDGGVTKALRELTPGQLKTVAQERDDRVGRRARDEMERRDTPLFEVEREALPDGFALEPGQIEENSSTWRGLKRTWLRAAHQEPETQWAYNTIDDQVKDRSEFAAGAKRTLRQRPKSHMQRAVEQELDRVGENTDADGRVVLETLEVPSEEGQGETQIERLEEASILDARARADAERDGILGRVIMRGLDGRAGPDETDVPYGVVGGVKDKGRLVFTPLLVNDDPSSALPARQEVQGRLERANEIIAEANQAEGRSANLREDLLQTDNVGEQKVDNLEESERFDSLEEVYQASADELRQVEQIDEAAAEAIASRDLAEIVEGIGRLSETPQAFRDLFPEDTSPDRIDDAHATLKAHSVRMIEAMNGGKPFDQIIRSEVQGDGDYILNPVAFNKRMQLFDAAEVPVHPGEMAARVDDIGTAEEVTVEQEVPLSTIEQMQELGVEDESLIGEVVRQRGAGEPVEDRIRQIAQERGADESAIMDALQAEGDPETRTLPTRQTETETDVTLTVSLLEDIPDGFGSLVEGADPLQDYQLNADGNVSDDPEPYDNNTDGIFLLRDDVFEAFAESMGLDPESGAQKGITIDATPEEGALLGKYAYHRAGPEASRHLRETGQQGHLYKSAAKQTGDRPRREMQVAQDGTVRYQGRGGAEDPGTTEIPVSSLTANLSNGETVESFKKDQNLVVQAHANMNVEQDPGNGAAIDAANRLMREAHEGAPEHNERVERFEQLRKERAEIDDEGRREQIEQEMERVVDNVDVEQLGNQQIINVLVEGNTPSPLFEKVARHIITKDEEGGVPRIDEVDRPELVEQLMEENDTRTATERILSHAPLTPAILRRPRPHQYMKSVLRNYISARTLKPTQKHSFKSILAPYDPHLRKRVRDTDSRLDLDATMQPEGRELQPGEVLLHSGLKDMQIRWQGPSAEDGTAPFGEAFRDFQEAGGWDGAPETMRRQMELAGIRVPSDSMSGLRTLKVKGFVDRKGTESVVHPRDMEYLGGADLDIDKMFVYQDLPSEMMDAYRANQEEWQQTVTVDGEEVVAMEPPKTEKEAFEVEESTRGDQRPDGLLSPAERLTAAENTYEGNQILGVALNAANNFRTLHEGLGGGTRVDEGATYLTQAAREDLAERLSEQEGVDVNPESIAWSGTLAETHERLRTLKRQAVNFAADAADVQDLIDKFDTPGLMGRAIFDSVRLRYEGEDGNTRTTEVDPSALAGSEWAPSMWQQYRDVAQARRLAKGKNYDAGRAYTLQEMTQGPDGEDGLRDLRLNPALGEESPASFLRGADLLGELQVDNPFRPSHGEIMRREVPPEMGENFSRMVEIVDRFMKSGSTEAKLMQRMAARTPQGDNSGISLVQQEGQPEGIDPRDAAVNDIDDIVSVALLHDQAMKIPGARENPEQVGQRLTEIAQRIAEFDQAQKVRRGLVEEAQSKARSYITKEKGVEDIRQDLRDWFDGLEPAYQQWASTYMLSSMTPQDTGLEQFGRYDDAVQKLNELKDEGAGQDAIDEARAEVRDAKREWYDTRRSGSFWVNADVVPPQRVSEYFRAYNDFVQRTHADNLDPARVRELVENYSLGGGESLKARTGLEQIDQMQSAPFSQQQAQSFGERVVRLTQIDDDFTGSKEWQELGDRLENVLRRHPWVIRDGFEDTFAGLVSQVGMASPGKSPRTATKRDLEVIVGKLERMSERKEYSLSDQERTWADWFKFGPGLDRDMQPWDPDVVERRAPVLSVVENSDVGRIMDRVAHREGATVKVPMSVMGKEYEIGHYISLATDALERELDEKLDQELRWVDGVEDGEQLFEIAQKMREAKNPNATEQVKVEARKAEQRLEDEFAGKKYTANLPGSDELETGTGREIVQTINRHITRRMEEVYQNRIFSEEARQEWIEPYMDRSVEGPEGNGRLNTRQMANELTDAILRERGFFAGSIQDLPPIDVITEMVRQSQLNKIEVQTPDFDQQTFQRVQSYFEQEEGITISDPDALRAMEEYQAVLAGDEEAMQALPEGLVKDLTSALEGGETKKLRNVDDPLRSALEQQFTEENPFAFQMDKLRTGEVQPDAYWPRNGWPTGLLKELKRKKMKEKEAEGASREELQETEYKVEAEIGRLVSDDRGASQQMQRGMVNATITKDELNTPEWGYTAGHLMSRGQHTESGETLMGYDRTREALQRYQQQILNAQANKFGGFLRSELIQQFEENGRMGEDTGDWANFMRALNRDLMGAPGVFPDEWARDRDGKVGPYFFFADNPMREKAAAMADRMGFNGDWFLPEDSEGLKKGVLHEQYQRFSKFEGQWQLMSLLSTPGTLVQNVFGGSRNNIINMGFRHWRAATSRDLSTFRNQVNPDFETKDDLQRIPERHGATENFVVNEIQMNGMFSRLDESLTGGAKKRWNEILDAVKNDPEIDDSTVIDEIKGLFDSEEGRSFEQALERSVEGFKRSTMSLDTRARAEEAWEALVDGGAWFMRKSERKLRVDSWLGHYLKAHDTLHMNGQAFSMDHPWLVDMANRGVEATQFLYNNAERPAFSRTGVGRLFSRFQLYTWNAARFRRDVFQAAGEVGADPGTEAFQRVRRQMQSDMFIIGLATLLPFSIFDNETPPPIDQLSETAKLMFGDEEEREQAFYGTDWGPLNFAKPLKSFMPPSARYPEALFSLMLSEDWPQFSGYAVSQYFPFGRLANNTIKSFNEPLKAPDTMLRTPLMQMQSLEVDEGGSPRSRAATRQEPFDMNEVMEANALTEQQLQSSIEP